MKSRKTRGTAIAVLVLLLLITVSFAGCEMASLLPIVGKPNPDDNPIVEPTPDSTTPPADSTTEAPPSDEPVIRILHPLTGLETTSELSSARPVAFTLGNTAYALPQFGIGASDILLEVPIENGSTRLTMITSNYAALEKIGPIRSTRKYIADIVSAFDAIQVYAGTSDLSASVALPEYDTLDYLTQNLQSLCYRDTSRVMPHNLMTTGDLVSSEIGKLGYRTSIHEEFALPFLFADFEKNALPGATACSEFTMTYSASQNARFLYSAESGFYTRSQLGEPQIDGTTGEAVAFKNVLVLFSDSATYETAEGTEFELLLKGGSGMYMTDGTMQNVSWTFLDGVFSFFDADGNPLTVNRGSSYIGFMKISDANAVRIIR